MSTRCPRKRRSSSTATSAAICRSSVPIQMASCFPEPRPGSRRALSSSGASSARSFDRRPGSTSTPISCATSRRPSTSLSDRRASRSSAAFSPTLVPTPPAAAMPGSRTRWRSASSTRSFSAFAPPSSRRSAMDPKSDPTRHCLKPENWPEADRVAWAAAFQQGGLLDGGGAAASWRPTTRKAVQDAYGRYLTFLARRDWLDPTAGPAERLTPEWLRAFIAELQPTVAPITLRNRITNLSEALRVMVPEAMFPYLQRARARLKARSRPVRNKRLQVVPIRQLFALGVDLIRRAEAEDAERELWNASLYRDGVMILILTCRPLRRSNVAAMVLGQHLLRRGECYVLKFDEDETKNRR